MITKDIQLWSEALTDFKRGFTEKFANQLASLQYKIDSLIGDKMTIEQTVDLIKTGYIDPSQVREAQPIIAAINQRIANALEKALVDSPPIPK